MTTTTPNMNLVLPDVLITTGPQWATLLDAAYTLIDSHNHSTGQGVAITPSGLNISSDLTFASNNATNLRTARLFNNSAITLGVNDKTCLYSLNNELYYVDGAGNNVQVTLGGTLNLAGGVSSLTINDSQFLLQYFGDTSRKFRFNASAIPTATTRIISVPDSGNNDTMVTQAATQVVTNKTLSDTTTIIGQVSDNTKAIKFGLSGATTSTATTILGVQTANRNITLPDATGTVVLKDTTDQLSNKSFITTTTIRTANLLTFNNSANTFSTSLSAGTNLANASFFLPIADGSNGQAVITNGSGQLSFTSIPTVAGNVAANDSAVVFTNADNRHQSCLPTAVRTYTLPTTSIPSGDTWVFDNQSLFLITINSSGGNLVGYVYPKSSSEFVALVSTPTTAANWNYLIQSPVPSTVAANDSAVVLTITDNRIQVCTPTVARTYTLPTTGVSAGDSWTFVNKSTTAAAIITVQSSGSNTVSYCLPTGTLTVVALQSTPTTAAHWLRTEASSDWIAYTPTFTGIGTASAVACYYRRNRNTMEVKGVYTLGTVAAANYSFTLGGGFSLDTGVISGTTVYGLAIRGLASTLNVYNTFAITGTSTTAIFLNYIQSGTYSPIAVNVATNIAGSGETHYLNSTGIPIALW